jgi:hypothetical protein
MEQKENNLGLLFNSLILSLFMVLITLLLLILDGENLFCMFFMLLNIGAVLLVWGIVLIVLKLVPHKNILQKINLGLPFIAAGICWSWFLLYIKAEDLKINDFNSLRVYIILSGLIVLTIFIISLIIWRKEIALFFRRVK